MGPRVTKSLSPADRALADFVATFYADPLGFVQACYPWGEPGPLAQHTGPDTWQAQQLAGIGADVRAHAFNGHDPVPAIRRVTSSGHGIGKSAEVAWLVDWIMSTRPTGSCRRGRTAKARSPPTPLRSSRPRRGQRSARGPSSVSRATGSA